MARSPQVLALQKQLLAAGFDPGPLDGIMGPRTRAAQAAFNARAVAAPTPAPAPAAPVVAAPTPAPQNTLDADPAMLAFLRTSGLSLETAANQVRNQTAAINAAKDVALGDLANQYGERSRTTAGSREARGVLRSSGTQQALDQVERARMNATVSKQNEAAGQISGLNQGLVNQVLGQQQKAAELGLSTGQAQDYNDQIQGIKKKYQSELAQGGLGL